MKERKFTFTCFLIITGLSAGLFYSGCRRDISWHKKTLLFFDTLCQIQLQCGKDRFTKARREIQDIFTETEKKFSPGSVDYASSETAELFRIADRINKDSGGAFDITVAPLSRLWGFRSGKYTIPSQDEIQSVLKDTGMNKIRELNGRLKVPENLKLDWGGIAKGWGIDRACRKLKEMGISSGFINAGGDLICWGRNPDKTKWQVGVTHPRREGFLGILSITDRAAATTGDYQRYFIHEGKRYHHIFDPATGYPARGKQSVTVVGPQTVICDGLATALFVSKDPEAVLSRYPEYSALVVSDKGKLRKTGRKPLQFHGH